MNTELKFEPSEELLDFADWFSKNWKILSEGEYTSNLGNYKIEYFNCLPKKSCSENTNFRVGLTSGVIQASKKRLEELDSENDFVFFMVIWCTIEFKVRLPIESDRIALEFYNKTSRSIKKVVMGYLNLLKNISSSESKRRMQLIMLIAKREEQKFNKNRIRILL